MRARLRDAPIFYDFGRVCRELWIVIFFGGGGVITSIRGGVRPLLPLLVLHASEPEFDNDAFVGCQLDSTDQC